MGLFNKTRFTKVVEDDADGKSMLFLIDSDTKDKVLTMSGDVIINMVTDLGEDQAQAALLTMVETYYPNLTKAEIKEFFK